jgi:hypothetical protein
MTAFRDAVRDASPSRLDELVQEGRVTPEKLWDELLGSASRSAALLSEIASSNRTLIDFLDERLPELSARQDGIDRMLAGERSNLGSTDSRAIDARIDRHSGQQAAASRRPPKAKRNG